MSNHKEYTDRELIVKIASDVENIKVTQKEKFDTIFNKLDNYGKRISDVEIEQATIRGRYKNEKLKIETLENAIEAKPSAGKIIIWVAVIVSAITSLGVFANVIINNGGTP